MVSSALSFIGVVHINARALLYINLIWFGNIARLSQWGEEEEDNFLVQMVLPAVAMCRGGGGGGSAPAPCGGTQCCGSGSGFIFLDPEPFRLCFLTYLTHSLKFYAV